MDIHPDLTPGVMTGLAWYFLLAAMLNAAAAAYVAYMEMVSEGASRAGLAARSRRLPDWLVVAYFGLYGAATLLILARGMFPKEFAATTVAYGLCALANIMLAIAAGADAAHFAEEKDAGHGVGQEVGAPSLDDHIPAVGIGGPINRTLWTLVWAVAAVIFQAMGIVYALHHEYGLPDFIRNAIDFVSGPTTFFAGATLAFIAMYKYRRFFANGLVAWGIVNAFLLFFGLSVTDYDFRDIVTKPDNVPIVGLIVLVGFFTWVALRRAVINDSRMAQGLPNLEELEPRGRRSPGPTSSAHRADRDGRADDRPGRPGRSRCRPRWSSRPSSTTAPNPSKGGPGTSSGSRRCSSTSTRGWRGSSCRA